jgi:hypothetical protein
MIRTTPTNPFPAPKPTAHDTAELQTELDRLAAAVEKFTAATAARKAWSREYMRGYRARVKAKDNPQ